MSTDDDGPGSASPPQYKRRKSFVELLTGRSPEDASTTTQTSAARGTMPAQSSSAMATAMAQSAQQQSNARRLSITTLGLSGSPPQPPTSPFGSLRRGYSVQERSSEEMESAVEEGDSVPPPSGGSDMSPSNSNSFRRRMSFGGLAYKDGKGPNTGQGDGWGSNGNGQPGFKSGSPPNKDGFDWTENLRKRAERTSVSAPSGGGMLSHMRSKSMASSAAQPVQHPAPPQPVPQPAAPAAPAVKRPDHFQERILKGDFYMD